MASIGEILEEARIKQGRTIKEAAQETRISPRFIEAFELDRFEDLPAPGQARHFLRSYATYLKLSPGPLVDAFERFTAETEAPDTGPIPAQTEAGPVTAPVPAEAKAPPARLAESAVAHRRPTRDPFRRTPPPPAPVTTMPASTDEDDAKALQDDGVDADRDAPAAAVAGAWAAGQANAVSAPSTTAGVLRGDHRGGRGRLWLIALAGGTALVALVVFAIVALANRGDGNNAAAPPVDTATATPGVSSVIAVTSETATPAAHGTTVTTTATATPTNIDKTSETAVSTATHQSPTVTITRTAQLAGNPPSTSTQASTNIPAGAHTNTNIPAGAPTNTNTPTRVPTARPTPLPPTPTPIPPTPTPTPPTPTQPQPTPTAPPPTPTPTLPPPTPTQPPPTPVPVNVETPRMYDLCPSQGNERLCGNSPFTVVCAPHGAFVDPYGTWVQRAQDYGWKVTSSTYLDIQSVNAACS